MNFYILRDDGCYYAGTLDRNAIWVSDKARAAAFRTRDQADVRISGLPEADYEVVT